MAKPLRKSEAWNDRDERWLRGPYEGNLGRRIAQKKSDRRRERRVALKRLTREEVKDDA